MKLYKVKSFKKIREQRQQENNKKAADSLLTKCVNKKAITRMLETQRNVGLSEEEFYNRLKSDKSFCIAAAMYCAINAARQGSTDEKQLINGISDVFAGLWPDVSLKQSGVNKHVPIKKTGAVLTRKDAKEKGYGKSDMLKSFDFEGKIKNRDFLGFAKICTDDGGHQDNVFEETTSIIDWLNEHSDSKKYYFILVDFENNKPKQRVEDELVTRIKQDNVFICNHVEFQLKVRELYEQ
jgi:hypothetical protein